MGRVDMIRRILEHGLPVHEVAKGFGISARTAHKCPTRIKAEGPTGLENRSRASDLPRS
ncbi:hypothetical protein [Microvirga sp. P5_D2]